MDDTKSCYKLIKTVTISKKTNAIFFCEKAFNSKNPNLGKVSQAQTQSHVTTSSILGNPQFGRVSVCWYGYCDKF